MGNQNLIGRISLPASQSARRAGRVFLFFFFFLFFLLILSTVFHFAHLPTEERLHISSPVIFLRTLRCKTLQPVFIWFFFFLFIYLVLYSVQMAVKRSYYTDCNESDPTRFPTFLSTIQKRIITMTVTKAATTTAAKKLHFISWDFT